MIDNEKCAKGKHAWLKRELSLPLKAAEDSVCMVMVEDITAMTQEAGITDIPKAVAQAMNSDGAEYWKAAMLD